MPPIVQNPLPPRTILHPLPLTALLGGIQPRNPQLRLRPRNPHPIRHHPLTPRHQPGANRPRDHPAPPPRCGLQLHPPPARQSKRMAAVVLCQHRPRGRRGAGAVFFLEGEYPLEGGLDDHDDPKEKSGGCAEREGSDS